jgi:hypothetical protein
MMRYEVKLVGAEPDLSRVNAELRLLPSVKPCADWR